MMTEVVCLLISLLAIFPFSANVLCSFFYWLIRAFLIIEFQELFSLLNCKNSQMTNARNEPSVICVTNIFFTDYFLASDFVYTNTHMYVCDTFSFSLVFWFCLFFMQVVFVLV